MINDPGSSDASSTGRGWLATAGDVIWDMGQTRSVRHGIVIALCKVAIVVVAVIVCLLVGAFSLNAHNDGLLVVAGLCAIAALGLTVLGALWIFQSVRVLVKTGEK